MNYLKIRELSNKTLWSFADNFKKQIKIKKEFVLSNNLILDHESIDKVWDLEDFDRNDMKIISRDNFPDFGNAGNLNILECYEKLLDSNDTYDFIICDLPFGMSSRYILTVKNRRGPRKYRFNWVMMSSALDKLSEDGFLFFIVEPAITWSLEGKKFLAELEKKDCYVSGIINMPPGSRQPSTGLMPYILIFSKKRKDKLFIAEFNYVPYVQHSHIRDLKDKEVKDLKINNDGINNIISNFFENKSSNDIENGLWVHRKNFYTFSSFALQQDIKALRPKNTKEYKLSTIARINKTASTKNEKNSIYLSKFSNKVFTSFEDKISKNSHNYFQIIVDEEKILSYYLFLFYNSDLGKNLLNNYKIGSYQEYINLTDFIESAVVYAPKIPMQKNIIDAFDRLNKMESKISIYKKDITIDPNNVKEILNRIDQMESAINALSEESKILALIRQKEKDDVEFKETFRKNIDTKQDDPAMKKAVLKTINAFLNNQDGILLIGISDTFIIKGIEKDIYKDDDNYLLSFKDILNQSIPTENRGALNNIKVKIVAVEGKKVLKVNVKKYTETVGLKTKYYNDKNNSNFKKEVWIRNSASSEKCEGMDLVNFEKDRRRKKT